MDVRLLLSPEVQETFPGLTARLISLVDLTVAGRDGGLEAYKAATVARLRETLALETLKDEPLVRAYRAFFWRMGVDPTKIRPASEALLRRILRGRDLPRINTLVDAYNLASMETRIALAAFDLATVEGTFTMRFAHRDEAFRGIGMPAPRALGGNEVVVEDVRGLVAVYPYRDADRTKVTPATRGAVIMVCGAPGIEGDVLAEAAERTLALVTKFCGGRVAEDS